MFKKWKQKRLIRHLILREVLETLCTICLYMESEGRHKNPHARKFGGHFDRLKTLSRIIREEQKNADIPNEMKEEYPTNYMCRWI